MPGVTADEIIASVLKHRSVTGAEFFIAPGVAVLVDEVMMLRSDLERLRHRERVCDSQCGPIQFMADAWYRAEREFDLPDDDPYEAIVRLREELEIARADIKE